MIDALTLPSLTFQKRRDKAGDGPFYMN